MTLGDKAQKIGVENKAFEPEENKMKNKEYINHTGSDLNKDNVTQSQIEMGFTESMVCSNKLQIACFPYSVSVQIKIIPTQSC